MVKFWLPSRMALSVITIYLKIRDQQIWNCELKTDLKGSSLIGPVLEAWNKSSDQKHELAMLHAQAEVQSKIQDQKLEATIVAAHKEQASTVRKGPVWLAALSGSVRPVVNYLIIIEFLAINWAIAWVVISEDGVTVQSLRGILDTDFMGLVSCVVAFWFGNRTFGKRKT